MGSAKKCRSTGPIENGLDSFFAYEFLYLQAPFKIHAMIATLVHINVKPEFASLFIEATKENHLQSVRENGNFRFDVLQDVTNPAKFVLYEVFESEAAAAAHKETGHYLKWRDTVATWMAIPREGVKHTMLFPGK